MPTDLDAATKSAKTQHPGRTAAQRRVIDHIGAGNHSPLMAKTTRDAMLNAGLIHEIPGKSVLSISGIRITVRQFNLPISVHMAWCNWCAENCPDDK